MKFAVAHAQHLLGSFGVDYAIPISRHIILGCSDTGPGNSGRGSVTLNGLRCSAFRNGIHKPYTIKDGFEIGEEDGKSRPADTWIGKFSGEPVTDERTYLSSVPK